MKIMPGELKLYAVTDRAWARDSDGVIRQVEAAVKGGATFVQVREKNLPAQDNYTGVLIAYQFKQTGERGL